MTTEQNSGYIYSLPIRRPVTMAMIFLSLVVFGWKSYQQLSINLMPDISYPTLTVRTEYEDAAPEDVEKLLTRPLEETLSIVSGLVEIRSISSAGLSEIVLEFTWGSDMSLAQQEVRDRLDLFTPPEEVTEQPIILRYDPTLDPVFRLAITGEDLSHIADPDDRAARQRMQLLTIREACERHIKKDLEGQGGVAQVLVKGGIEEEIQILLDADHLKSLGLGPDAVVNALAQQNINLSAGKLKEGKTEYLVRTLNEYETVDEIRETLIPVPTGELVKLSNVARVDLGQMDRETVVRINGREAVELELFKEGDANTVEVCNRLKDLFGFDRKMSSIERLSELAEKATQSSRSAAARERDEQLELSRTLEAHLPPYADLTIISDQSRFIIAAIEEVQSSALTGGLLALIVLFFFLREFKPTMITGIAIPVSIVATFVPMFLQDISLNIMSLGGLALGVGMLVDNSIVVLESIFRCREEGDDTVMAADRGTREVAAAVTASTFTTVAVFLPITFVEGVAGQLFRDLALTVTFSLLASLFVALYLNPMMASRAKLSLLSKGNTVWLMRAYRDGRDGGAGRRRALGQILPRTLGFVGNWLKDTTQAAFEPVGNNLRYAFKRRDNALAGILAKSVLLFTPVLAICLLALYVLQVLLGIAMAFTITGFFLVSVVLGGFVWTAVYIFKAVLWLPLELFEKSFNAFRSVYGQVLRRSLVFSPIVIVLTLLVAAHAGFVATQLGSELIPPMKQGEFNITIEAPPGTRLEEMDTRAQVVEQLIINSPTVETVAVQIGQEQSSSEALRGENMAQFTVRLENPEENAARQDEVIEKLRAEIHQVTSDPFAFSLPALFSFKSAVEIQIFGDEIMELRAVGERALAAIKEVTGIRDAELNMTEGYPEIIIELDRDLLAEHSLTAEQVARRLRTEVQGDVASRFNQGGEKIDIRVRSDRRRLSGLDDLRRLNVSEGSIPVPLYSVAELISVQKGPSEIRRIGQRRVALISANVEDRDLGSVTEDIMATVVNVEKPIDYDILPGGQTQERATSERSLKFALLLAIFLVYVVMACQFESLWHPALVMFTVPLAFIGVIYTLNWMNFSVSIVVFLGGIVLAGIVVNDAIVLVDYINQLRRRGMNVRDAVVEAGQVRLRPIMMTTLTTVLGLLPMALWSGEGGEIRQPMAVTVIAGLSSATILTLVIIPMAYYIFTRRSDA